uniref:BPTI/Kunitz inhibitor domain-containing protein n=1 Tax=Romanomermis culicivorax TaxID=13658 RepID=A0A915HMY0_ROMCU
MDDGECHGLFEVYGYNTTSKRCELFYYGGCGTENAFEYEAGCKRVCIDKKEKPGSCPSKSDQANRDYTKFKHGCQDYDSECQGHRLPYQLRE